MIPTQMSMEVLRPRLEGENEPHNTAEVKASPLPTKDDPPPMLESDSPHFWPNYRLFEPHSPSFYSYSYAGDHQLP